MFRHRAYGFALHADIRFDELDPVQPEDELPSIRIETGAVSGAPASLRYQSLWPSGELYFASYGDGRHYVLHFPAFCDAAVDVARLTVRVSSSPFVPTETLRHVLLDQVVPRTIAGRGHAVLHASAIDSPAGTLAFLGQGGAGKSSLAAAFCAAGHALVCDDALVVAFAGGRAWATPGYPTLRLLPETANRFFGATDLTQVAHYTHKMRVRPRAISRRVTPMLHILLPEVGSAGETPRLERLRGQEAFFALLQEAYRMDAVEPAILARDTGLYADLASRCPVSRLVIPDDLGALPEVRDWTLSALKIGQPCVRATATQ